MYAYLVNITKYLLGILGGMEDVTGRVPCGKMLGTTLEAIDRSKIVSGEVLGELLLCGFNEGVRDECDGGS